LNLLDRDLFELYRWLLTTVCTIYATVVTVRAALFYAGILVGSDRKAQVVRNYAFVLFLRLRVARFKNELLGIGFFAALFLLIVYWHQ